MQQQLALICCCLTTSILTFNYVPRLESPAEPKNNCTQVSHDAVAAASSQKAERKFQKERKKEKERERFYTVAGREAKTYRCSKILI